MIKKIKQFIQSAKNFSRVLLDHPDKNQLVYTQEEKEVISGAQNLISNKAYEQLFILVKNGYQMTKEQKKQLSIAFSENFNQELNNYYSGSLYLKDKNQEYPFVFNQLLSYGYEITPFDVGTVFSNRSFSIACSDVFVPNTYTLARLESTCSKEELAKAKENALSEPRGDFRHIVEHIKTSLADDKFSLEVYQEWEKRIIDSFSQKKVDFHRVYGFFWHALKDTWVKNGNLDANSLTQLHKKITHLLSSVSKDSYGYDLFKKDTHELLDNIQGVINQLNMPNFFELLNKTKKTYSQHLIDIKKDNLIKFDDKVKNLPQETYQKFLLLQETCFNLEKHKDILNLEQTHSLKKIMEQSLPDILDTYFNIPQNMRNTILKDDKKAIDYVNNSLDNLQEHLLTFNHSLAENYLQDLVVAEKYTKKLSMH